MEKLYADGKRIYTKMKRADLKIVKFIEATQGNAPLSDDDMRSYEANALELAKDMKDFKNILATMAGVAKKM